MLKTQEYLSAHGIRPSAQRIAIMNYLLTHKTHPTVDEIYTALHPELPTLSKTTLYNTLKLFYDKNVTLMLTLDERQTRFDGNVEPHAHFQCNVCGKVFDIMMEELPELKNVCKHKIGELTISTIELNYRGECASCRGEKN
ncbi:MAG: transcriptional repressor [Paludibacteraceae bacterium]|nr:transcriptional repressor [Paludibacteraceae bacterium]